MTREQELKYRKHIKPFLRYAIDNIGRKSKYLCVLAHLYGIDFVDGYTAGVSIYLKKRIQAARPSDSGNFETWMFRGITNYSPEYYRRKIDWCKQQLKIVNEKETKYT